MGERDGIGSVATLTGARVSGQVRRGTFSKNVTRTFCDEEGKTVETPGETPGEESKAAPAQNWDLSDFQAQASQVTSNISQGFGQFVTGAKNKFATAQQMAAQK